MRIWYKMQQIRSVIVYGIKEKNITQTEKRKRRNKNSKGFVEETK